MEANINFYTVKLSVQVYPLVVVFLLFYQTR